MRVRKKCGEGETRWTHMMQGLKKIRTGTVAIYRYPDVRVTASAVWGCRIYICLVRGVLGIGPHHIACDPVMGIIKPMKPTVEGSGSGRGG